MYLILLFTLYIHTHTPPPLIPLPLCWTVYKDTAVGGWRTAAKSRHVIHPAPSALMLISPLISLHFPFSALCQLPPTHLSQLALTHSSPRTALSCWSTYFSLIDTLLSFSCPSTHTILHCACISTLTPHILLTLVLTCSLRGFHNQWKRCLLSAVVYTVTLTTPTPSLTQTDIFN